MTEFTVKKIATGWQVVPIGQGDLGGVGGGRMVFPSSEVMGEWMKRLDAEKTEKDEEV